MKLATFDGGDGEPRAGVVDTARGRVTELEGFVSMLDLIDQGPAALARARDQENAAAVTHDLASVTLLAPLQPRSIRDCLAFEEHLRNAAKAIARLMGGEPVPNTGNVLGPWIVTADELGDPHSLAMVARVNGEEWSRGTSAAMHHRFDRILAFISQSETLHPGELIGSGTVGTGCGLELGRFPQDGDVVELEIERIGVLRNRFVTEG